MGHLFKGICHQIFGTDGEQFGPFIAKKERKWIFSREMCRSIWLDFDEEVEVNGILAYRYRPPFSVLDMTLPGMYYFTPTHWLMQICFIKISQARNLK